MLNIKKYHRVESVEEAYTLNQKKSNVIIGGMLWLKMQTRNVDTAIDMCDLGLDEIKEVEGAYHIGAMTSLRAIEVHQELNKMTNNALRDAMKQIVGVQFRNVATLGGSIFSKFGFSDVATILLALNAKVRLHKKGIISLSQFLKEKADQDILIEVIIEKKMYEVIYLSHRNTKTDFPVLTCAVTKNDEGYTCAIGARPQKAEEIHVTKDDNAMTIGREVAELLTFGSNSLASADYRKHLCEVLVMRGVETLQKKG